MRYARNRGWNRLAFITPTDASGQDGDQAIDAALAMPENKDMTLVRREHFNGTDVTKLAPHTLVHRGLLHVPEGRRMLAQIGSSDSIELVLNRLVKTKNNQEFLATLSKAEAATAAH